MTSHLRAWQSYLVLFVLASLLLGVHANPVSSQRLHVIRVHVVDQYFQDYDGVTVEVSRGELVDSGLTIKGTWTSKPLEGQGRLYDVHVYNGQEETRTVRVDSNVALEFILERRSPAPTLLVSNVIVTPELVMVGGTFRANLTVQNVGKLKTVTGVLSFNVSYPFALLESGTSIDIGGLDVGENRTLSSKFSVDSKARTGTFSILYLLSYSDPNDYSYTALGKFGVVVHGTPDVQVQDITVDPTPLNPASDGTFTIDLVNTGTEVALDATIKILNGQELFANSITYVGLIEPGTTKTIIFGIHVSPEASEGIRFLKIDVTYSDPAGNTFSLSKNYDLAVYEPEPFIPTYYYFFIAGGVAAVVGIYLALRRLGVEIW